MPNVNRLVLLRGGGDLASGVALRLHHAGFSVVITELAQPLAVRRAVSFADAVYQGIHKVEDAASRLVKWDQVKATLEAGEIPVLIDPEADILHRMDFFAVVDGRLLKQRPAPLPVEVPLHIGLGPGFHAGGNCHAVVETRRSHTLGRVFWSGAPQQDTGQPEGDQRRVLRAPMGGIVMAHLNIGDHVQEGQLIAEIQSEINNQKSEIRSPFKGVLRGLIHDRREVTSGLKIGDVDPRDDASACFLVSDKALAVGGGVLEAVLAKIKSTG
ncbi:MAG: selenium-dependent molybdenum cofactor biosynthesis protein YqeB [Chloroflexota bacterium]